MSPTNHVLDGVYIGATWQIRLNDPRSVAIRAAATITVFSGVIHYLLFVLFIAWLPLLRQ